LTTSAPGSPSASGGASYSTEFFDSIREGSQRSAAAVVPLVMETISPRTVVDVGCGEGWWGKAFEAKGCEVIGLDDDGRPIIPSRRVDLADTLPIFENDFDLAICLEVAEHLPLERAETFISELCGLSHTILFSAAVPGQGGTGHLNEQWPPYWAELFMANGFSCSDKLRWVLWYDERVSWWYRQNIFIASSRHDLVHEAPRPVIHPGAWTHFGHR
jgi:SAM-dependent methyltransferase